MKYLSQWNLSDGHIRKYVKGFKNMTFHSFGDTRGRTQSFIQQ